MKLRRTSRLREFSYVGPQAYFLTICTYRRQRAFEIESFARDATEKLLRSAATHRFALPAYCLMPDHVHLVAEGEPWTGSTCHTIGQILEAADDWRPTY